MAELQSPIKLGSIIPWSLPIRNDAYLHQPHQAQPLHLSSSSSDLTPLGESPACHEAKILVQQSISPKPRWSKFMDTIFCVLLFLIFGGSEVGKNFFQENWLGPSPQNQQLPLPIPHHLSHLKHTTSPTFLQIPNMTTPNPNNTLHRFTPPKPTPVFRSTAQVPLFTIFNSRPTSPCRAKYSPGRNLPVGKVEEKLWWGWYFLSLKVIEKNTTPSILARW